MGAAEATLKPAQVFVGGVGDGQRHSALVPCTSEKSAESQKVTNISESLLQ